LLSELFFTFSHSFYMALCSMNCCVYSECTEITCLKIFPTLLFARLQQESQEFLLGFSFSAVGAMAPMYISGSFCAATGNDCLSRRLPLLLLLLLLLLLPSGDLSTRVKPQPNVAARLLVRPSVCSQITFATLPYLSHAPIALNALLQSVAYL